MACLPDHGKNLRVGSKVVAIGWGSYTDDFNRNYHNGIQQASFEILDPDNTECNSGMVGK